MGTDFGVVFHIIYGIAAVCIWIIIGLIET